MHAMPALLQKHHYTKPKRQNNMYWRNATALRRVLFLKYRLMVTVVMVRNASFDATGNVGVMDAFRLIVTGFAFK